MNLSEVMNELEKLGSETTKKTLMKHGAHEPLFGVKITDMKKIVKHVKKDSHLVEQLYDTGNYDAMYLAGLSINPKNIRKELLEKWVNKASCYAIGDYAVARAAAESEFAVELARQWIDSGDELISSCGWSTYSNYASISNDINIGEVEGLLKYAEGNIHSERNRVKYNMNGFVISVGSYIKELNPLALKVAENIGIVKVDMGLTSCKVPNAKEYIEKVMVMDRVGKKRKRCIC